MATRKEEIQENARPPINHVPDKTIIRYMSKENNELRAENAELKEKVRLLEAQLERKAEAIAAFKEWQGKVEEQKLQYWLTEGLQLLQTPPPDKELIKTLRQYLSAVDMFRGQVHTLTLQMQKMEEKRAAFEEVIETLKTKTDETEQE